MPFIKSGNLVSFQFKSMTNKSLWLIKIDQNGIKKVNMIAISFFEGYD
jgi:hypothetical protein